MDSLKRRRVLIVDDEEADRMLLAAYLQRYSCDLFFAEDGFEGIEKARILRPDIILLDAHMPRYGGYEACRVLSNDPLTRDIPIIFISALALPEQRIRGLLVGAVDYISKPFDFNEVKLRLMVHLRRKAPVPAAKNASEGESAQPRNLHAVLFHSARVYLLKSLSAAPVMQELEKLTGTNSKN